MEPVTGNTTLDHVLTILGALVPVFSAVASFFNHRIRVTQASGGEASPGTLAVVSLMNLLSMNIDKGLQLARLAKGQDVPHTEQPTKPE